MSQDKKDVNYNNGIIDGVLYSEEEEKKLMGNKAPKSKLIEGGLFKIPDLNE